MKKILLALSALVSISALAAPQAPAPQGSFETRPGCIWSHDVARCAVDNHSRVNLSCTVHVFGRTERGFKIGNTRTVSVPAFKYNDDARLYVAEGDKFVKVDAEATCTPE